MKKFYKWTDTAIMFWHQKALPCITGVMQLEKIEEELREVRKEVGKSIERQIEEWADVSIACAAGYRRFRLEVAYLILEYIKTRDDYHEIMVARDKKMDINLTRTWEGNHHVEKTA